MKDLALDQLIDRFEDVSKSLRKLTYNAIWVNAMEHAWYKKATEEQARRVIQAMSGPRQYSGMPSFGLTGPATQPSAYRLIISTQGRDNYVARIESTGRTMTNKGQDYLVMLRAGIKEETRYTDKGKPGFMIPAQNSITGGNKFFAHRQFYQYNYLDNLEEPGNNWYEDISNRGSELISSLIDLNPELKDKIHWDDNTIKVDIL